MTPSRPIREAPGRAVGVVTPYASPARSADPRSADADLQAETARTHSKLSGLKR